MRKYFEADADTDHYGTKVIRERLGIEWREMRWQRDIGASSDVALVFALARWEEDALAELYRRHSGPVYALAFRVLASDALAEEVTQDVFLRLWNAPERFDPERGSLRSYLLAQTHGRSVDLVRSERARRTREERVLVDEARPADDIEREVWDYTVAEHVRRSLAELSDGERRAIELAYYGGYTYKEVAALLHEPEGTIKSRIRSGLSRLRDALAYAGVAEG